MPDVRVLNYSGSGIETTFTQGEDACLASWYRKCRQRIPRRCWWSAHLPTLWRTSSVPCSTEIGIRTVISCRRSARPTCRAWGRILATCSRSRSSLTRHGPGERGANALPAPFPLGVDGTTRWFKAAARDVRRERRSISTASQRRGSARGLDLHWNAYREELAGKRVFFFPDSQLEVPLARFLARELDMSPSEVGSPYLHASTSSEELELLPEGTQLSEGQDVERSSIGARGTAGYRRLRPRARQPARSRGDDHQVVHRTPVHAHPRLRTGGDLRRAVCPTPPPTEAGGLMQLTRLDIRGSAARRCHARRNGHARRALRAARTAGRYLRRPLVHHDRASRSSVRR
jgi:hypothetical protein